MFHRYHYVMLYSTWVEMNSWVTYPALQSPMDASNTRIISMLPAVESSVRQYECLVNMVLVVKPRLS